MAAMDSSNHWYGHAHALARYCGLETPPPIHGVIQHGWTFVHGYGAAHQPPLGMTKFTWSDVCRRRGQILGWRDYLSIGAPFLYLDHALPEEEGAREGTIWYPFHGTPDFEQLAGNHQRLIDQINQTEDGPVTMCLYFVEYEIPEVRRLYEDAGFRVICHGQRGIGYTGTDVEFMTRQLTELRRHKRVASNRLATAILYGAQVGCDVAIYGDPMELVGVKAGFNGEELFRAWWPEMFSEDVDGTFARRLAADELGVHHMMPPEELAHTLGWTHG